MWFFFFHLGESFRIILSFFVCFETWSGKKRVGTVVFSSNFASFGTGFCLFSMGELDYDEYNPDCRTRHLLEPHSSSRVYNKPCGSYSRLGCARGVCLHGLRPACKIIRDMDSEVWDEA